jgi:hypothetical protein
MNMTQYKNLHYSDSDALNGFVPTVLEATNPEEDEEAYEAELLRKLEAGEISENQYNTLTRTNARKVKKPEDNLDENGFILDIADLEAAPSKTEEPQVQTPQYQIDSSYWTDQLTDSDINYLMLK